jgi:hypothetical protein
MRFEFMGPTSRCRVVQGKFAVGVLHPNRFRARPYTLSSGAAASRSRPARAGPEEKSRRAAGAPTARRRVRRSARPCVPSSSRTVCRFRRVLHEGGTGGRTSSRIAGPSTRAPHGRGAIPWRFPGAEPEGLVPKVLENAKRLFESAKRLLAAGYGMGRRQISTEAMEATDRR